MKINLFFIFCIIIFLHSCSSSGNLKETKNEKWFYWPSEYNELNEKKIALEKELTKQKELFDEEISKYKRLISEYEEKNKIYSEEIANREQQIQSALEENKNLKQKHEEGEKKLSLLSSQLKELESNLNKEIEAGQIKVKSSENRIDINIDDRIFFDSGSAELKKDSFPVLAKISDMLLKYPKSKITIEGHTDNVPLSPYVKFKSNWHLSNERANAVLVQILKNKALDPKIFSTKGYGEFQPLVPNDSPANRAINRRVNIVVQNQ